MHLITFPLLLAAAFPLPQKSIEKAFGAYDAAFVMIDCASGTKQTFHPARCAERLAPCATFKVYNTLIGLECGLVKDPNSPFWHWDGINRWLPIWDEDLTLKEAFSTSCTPAYQVLARKIGKERMASWLKKIHYGNQDLSAPIDSFWVFGGGTQNNEPIQISADEQAELLCKLVKGKLPFKQNSLHVLKDIMKRSQTPRGILYGKTGAGGEPHHFVFGWFVGYVESEGKTYAIACNIKGAKNNRGADAQTIVQNILTENKLL